MPDSPLPLSAQPTQPPQTGPGLSALPLTYRRRAFRRMAGALGLVLLAAGPAGAYAYWQISTAYTQYGYAAGVARARPWLPLAALALLLVFSLLLRWLLDLAPMVSLQPGVMTVRDSLGRTRRWRYEQLAGVSTLATQDRFLGLPVARRRLLRVYPTTGKPFFLPQALANQAELETRLKQQLYPLLQPQYQSELAAGKRVHFGAVSLERQTLSLSGKVVPRQNLRRVHVHKGWLVVEWDAPNKKQVLQPRRLRVAVEHIPNLELLFQMLQQGGNA